MSRSYHAPMTARELFVVFVRTTGLVLIVVELVRLLPLAVLVSIGAFTPGGGMSPTRLGERALMAIIPLAIGYYLLRGAPQLVRMCYGSPPGRDAPRRICPECNYPAGDSERCPECGHMLGTASD